ncbi:MAG: hypothetical protein NTV51_24135, partial [Verrucomicrobia bacterium]|nr:hypothetical protein [Verrucomicrobiota bacterium]
MSTDFSVHENAESAPPPWEEVARVCRRICLLRSTGRSLDAARLQSTELSRLLTAMPSAPETDHRLHVLFAEEERRIADAHALAEILVPLIVEQLRALLPHSTTPALATGHFATEPAATPRPVRTEAPGIADFIDDMIAQERPAPR